MIQKDYASLIVTQRRLIVSIRNIEPSPECSVLKQLVAELFSQEVLFSKDFQHLSGINAKLRDFLNGHRCNLSQRPSKIIIHTLAHELYDDAEKRNATLERDKAIVATGKRAVSLNNVQIFHSTIDLRLDNSLDESNARVATNVAIKLKTQNQNFRVNWENGEMIKWILIPT